MKRREFSLSVPLRAVSIGLLLLGIVQSAAVARTWYVKADGTGDAPTIQAGIDSAVAGDVVLVGAGTYQVETDIMIKPGITLRSELGPYETKIVPGLTIPGVALEYFTLAADWPPIEIDGFWIEGFLEWRNPDGMHGEAYGILLGGPATVRNNVIVGNGIGLRAHGSSGTVDFRNNTVVGNGVGLNSPGGLGIQCWYNIVWDEVAGAVSGMLNDVLDFPAWGGIASGNFSQDPEFCGPSLGNYFLQSDSPCAPGNCPLPIQPVLIGALPVACGTVKTEAMTWGAIKELYE